MLWEYIKEIAESFFEFGMGGAEMIEFLICGIVFFIPKFIKRHEETSIEGEHSVRRILLHKFMTNGEWRFFVTAILCIICQFLIIGPYRVYHHQHDIINDQKNSISGLNTQLISSSNELSNLTASMHTKDATIQAEQTDNSKLQSQIDSIFLDDDASAIAVRKKCRILADQTSSFIQTKWSESSKYQVTMGEIMHDVTLIPDSKTLPGTILSGADLTAKFNIVQGELEAKYSSFWKSTFQQFDIEFGGKIKRLKDQINDLGYQTPKIDFLITNRLEVYTNSSYYTESEMMVIPPISAAAQEMQALSSSIKLEPVTSNKSDTKTLDY